jgi:hypothetical protein
MLAMALARHPLRPGRKPDWAKLAQCGGLVSASIFSLVKKNAFLGEKSVDILSPLW